MTTIPITTTAPTCPDCGRPMRIEHSGSDRKPGDRIRRWQCTGDSVFRADGERCYHSERIDPALIIGAREIANDLLLVRYQDSADRTKGQSTLRQTAGRMEKAAIQYQTYLAASEQADLLRAAALLERIATGYEMAARELKRREKAERERVNAREAKAAKAIMALIPAQSEHGDQLERIVRAAYALRAVEKDRHNADLVGTITGGRWLTWRGINITQAALAEATDTARHYARSIISTFAHAHEDVDTLIQRARETYTAALADPDGTVQRRIVTLKVWLVQQRIEQANAKGDAA